MVSTGFYLFSTPVVKTPRKSPLRSTLYVGDEGLPRKDDVTPHEVPWVTGSDGSPNHAIRVSRVDPSRPRVCPGVGVLSHPVPRG